MSASVVGVLLPEGNGEKFLNPIRLFAHLSPIVLGRNEITGLTLPCPNSAFVCRQHVVVRIDPSTQKVFVTSIGRRNSVALQQTVLPIREEREWPMHGLVSLLGAAEWYNYRLCPPDMYTHEKREGEEEAAAAVALPKEKQLSTVTQEDWNGIVVSSFDCPICQDTIAYTCVLSPCGCNFCYQCIEFWFCAKKQTACPCCKQTFDLRYSMTNSTMDMCILSAMNVSKKSREEMEEWQDRVAVGHQRRRAFYELHPSFLPSRPAEPAPPAAPAPAPEPTLEQLLPELIRARAIQVVDAAALPENAGNANLQERASRAREVLLRLQSRSS